MVTCTLKGGSRDNEVQEGISGSSQSSQILERMNGEGAKDPSTGPLITSQMNGCKSLPFEQLPVYHPIKSVKSDFYERPEFLSVTLYIKNIQSECLKVDFSESRVLVNFRTSDQSYLKQYPFLEERHHYLQWAIELKGRINAAKCRFTLKPSNLTLRLPKMQPGSWGSLELAVSSDKEVESETWISLAPKAPKSIKEEMNKSVENVVFVVGNAQRQASVPPQKEAKELPLVKLGYTGLGNLGNTCYMNAVLQVLANTTRLRNHFTDRKFQSEINTGNPLGFGGSLALAFAIIIRQLWSGKEESIEPCRLKKLLADRASQFAGYAQHDAQEFMAFLLDGLHEDLNRVKCKPLTSPVESNGRPDAQVAEEAWRVYKMRNDSIIVDLFQGQYRSTLICPACQKVSVTFDPFLYLSLPLPPLQSWITVTCFPRKDSAQPVKLPVLVNENSGVLHLKEEIRKQMPGWSGSQVQLMESYKGAIRRILSDHIYLSSLHNPDALVAFETLTPSPTCPTIDIPIIQRLLVPSVKHTYCAACKRENSDAVKLKRCVKCLDVSYCDRACQRNHWDVHRPNCRPKPVVTSHPFIISLARAELTYNNIYQSMLTFSARFFIQAARISSSNNDSNQEMDWPMFFIRPVDYMGQSIPRKERLEDRGDELLDVEDVDCLSLDWRNNENSPQHCSIVEKEVVYSELDPSATSQHQGDPNRVTLHRCLEQFMQPEVLGHEEAWYCPQCQEHREATKQMSLWRLPDILTIQLKRFSFRNLLWRDKIDKKVHFPTRGLDLSPYLSQSVGSGNAVYDLIGVVNHYGGIISGHYTAFARCPSVDDNQPDEIGWRCMDDRFVRDVGEHSVVTPAAYLLLYRRRSDPQQSSSPAYSDPDQID